jgi:hypothetical protein
MEHVVDKCLKLDDLVFDLQSTQPRPIKFSDLVSNSTRADVKALENAKTRKVTAAVPVLHLYGNARSSSSNANAKVSAKKTKLVSKSKK